MDFRKSHLPTYPLAQLEARGLSQDLPPSDSIRLQPMPTQSRDVVGLTLWVCANVSESFPCRLQFFLVIVIPDPRCELVTERRPLRLIRANVRRRCLRALAISLPSF